MRDMTASFPTSWPATTDIGWSRPAGQRYKGGMPALVLPTTSVHRSFLEAMDEFVAEGAQSTQTAAWIDRNAPAWTDPEVFAGFTEAVRADADEDTPRPDFHVPCTTLWWVDDEDYLGRIAIRHLSLIHI